jgi:predicted MFS family arabinose efflux permease
MQDAAPAPTKTAGGELRAYLCAIAAYFLAFGVQMILFPYLVANALGASPQAVGIAQAVSQLPMLILLLWGGLAAERMPTRAWLVVLHALAAAPVLVLALTIGAGQLSYAVMILFGVAMGTLTAFMMPARDAALNGVVGREAGRGATVTLQSAVALATAVQLGAQVLGMLLAGLAGRIPVEALLAVQATCLLLTALFCLGVARAEPPKPRTGRSPIADLREGLSLTLSHRVLLPMVLVGLYVGVFIIGSFSVLFPLLIRDVFAMGANALSTSFVAFWTGSFLSSVALSRLPTIARPGRALLCAQVLGALALAGFSVPSTFTVFVAIVFGWGLAAGVAFSMSRTIVQQAAPPAAIGRVLAVYSLGFMGGAPVGAALLGFAADQVGPRLAALVPALGLIVAVSVMAVRTPIWTLTRPDEP